MKMHREWTSVFAWSGLALLVAVLAACEPGATGETPSVPVVQVAEGEPAPASVPLGKATPATATDGEVASKPQQAAADVFKGTNLLEGVCAKLPKPAEREPADNSYCYVCHTNYQEESLAKTHASVGVGCESCHGMSDEHSADEDGLTPPGIMWPKKWINATCMECHPRDALVKQDGHRKFLREPLPDETCSGCHGTEHRLKVRTRVWDKKTRKLLSCDGVRMMDADSPAGAAK